MDDVIQRSGYKFGTNEAIILSQLSIAAAPTAVIMFLESITNDIPQVCVWYKSECREYMGDSYDVCENSTAEWSYVDPESTIIGLFDLLCQSAWWRSISRPIFYIGMSISCMCAGFLSDWVGRKPALMLLLLVEGISLGLLIEVDSYPWWLFLRFVNGLSVGYFVVSMILIIEGLKVEFRNWFLAAIWCSFSVGIMLLGVLNIACDSYVNKIAYVVVIIVTLWGLYIFGIQESLRWLIVKRKKEKAQYMLNKIAYRNSVTLPSYDEIPMLSDDQFSVLDLFKLKVSRCLIFSMLQLSILSFDLLSCSLMPVIVYSINTEELIPYEAADETSQSVGLIMSGAMNFVGVLASSCACYFLGRRATIIVLTLTALIDLVLRVVPVGETTTATFLTAYATRFVATGLLYCCSLYSLEFYITPLRAKAMGVVMAGAALGGIIASVKLILRHVSLLTSFTFSVLQILAVGQMLVMAFCLRETKGRPLPEHVCDMRGVLGVHQWCACGGEDTERDPLLGQARDHVRGHVGDHGEASGRTSGRDHGEASGRDDVEDAGDIGKDVRREVIRMRRKSL